MRRRVRDGVGVAVGRGDGPEPTLSRLFDGKVVDLGFDPKSEDYLLVATAGGAITLWSLDGKFSPSATKKPTQLTEFAKQGSGLCACRFVDSMPGTFVTASDRHGVLRVWNVSNSNPQHAIKMDQGAHPPSRGPGREEQRGRTIHGVIAMGARARWRWLTSRRGASDGGVRE